MLYHYSGYRHHLEHVVLVHGFDGQIDIFLFNGDESERGTACLLLTLAPLPATPLPISLSSIRLLRPRLFGTQSRTFW